MPTFLHYVVDDFPVRLIGLDTVIAGQHGGEICPAREAWLAQALANGNGRPTLVFMHHPPFRTGVAAMDPMMCRSAPTFAAADRTPSGNRADRHGPLPPADRRALGRHDRLRRTEHRAPGGARPARRRADAAGPRAARHSRCMSTGPESASSATSCRSAISARSATSSFPPNIRGRHDHADALRRDTRGAEAIAADAAEHADRDARRLARREPQGAARRRHRSGSRVRASSCSTASAR